MSDLQSLANPYDFANPVSDVDLFIGRKDEISEIRYYLAQAIRARRPTNLAIIGNRASGKTSLLNVTEQEGKKLGLLTVRIDLDEGDAASQWAFFFKIFDSVFSAACEAGAYGGKHSQTFDTYIEMVCSLSVPTDKTFCPFFFAIQYAKALGGNNLQGQVPDYSFRQDLDAIQAEVKRTIVILFDEGNVLSKSRVLLQKLRNVFMNSRGYMLVLTGTPEMFPMMDEVFSPIIRQFKKIAINRFEDREETEELIRRYLEAAEVRPESLFDFESSNDLEDIHDLTGGRPYEIQLVCHTLFRRVQQGRARKMSLDLGVIEEVRQQLESSQKLSDRPILSRVRTLDTQSLEALAVFAPCVDNASFEQISALERIFAPEIWGEGKLGSRFAYLKGENILGENAQGIVQFMGDDFDKIYTKYFSAEKDVPVQFSEFPFSIYTRMRLDAIARPTSDMRSMRPIQTSGRLIEIQSVVEEMSGTEGLTKVYVETPIGILRAIYKLLFDYQGLAEIPLADCSLGILGADAQAWYVPRRRDDVEALERCLSVLRGVQARAVELGCSCSVQALRIPIVPLDTILEQVIFSGNRRLAELIAMDHANAVLTAYTSKRTPGTIDRHATVAFSLREYLSRIGLNNLGYYYLAQGAIDNAITLLELSIAVGGKAGEPSSLAAFNLAMAHLKAGNRATSMDILQKISILKEEDDEPYCLFVPRLGAEGLALVEIRENPNLRQQVAAAIHLLSTWSDTSEAHR
ncbi:MAG TPA: hypothetical protein VJY15_23405 [Candidatus Acidoferrum sp.]|nr:hypothetical protein [Candidatus Acidoferrum sp.]